MMVPLDQRERSNLGTSVNQAREGELRTCGISVTIDLLGAAGNRLNSIEV